MDLSFDSARALYWLASNKESGFEQIPDEIFESDSRDEVLDELAVYELIKIDEANSSLLTQRGRVAAKKIKGIYRSELSKFRILEWLKADKNRLNTLDIEKTQFIEDFSGKLSSQEIQDATETLFEEKLISGIESCSWDEGLTRPQITTPGRGFLTPKTISITLLDSETISTVTSNNNYNQVFGDNNGTMNAQFQNNNGNGPETNLDDILQALTEILEQVDIDPEEKDELKSDLEGIKQKSLKRSTEWVKQSLSAFVTAVASAAGAETAQQFIEILKPYLQIGQ